MLAERPLARFGRGQETPDVLALQRAVAAGSERGFGVMDECLRFRVEGLALKVEYLGCTVADLGYRAELLQEMAG